MILLCVFCTLPILIFFFLLHNQHRLKEKRFMTMFGSFYQNLSIKNVGKFSFNVVFLIRRLLYALSIGTIFTSITIMSTLLQICMSTWLCLYIVHFRPFNEPKDNYIELMNELTIFFVFNMCLGFLACDDMTG